jgi:hypothetical protein
MQSDYTTASALKHVAFLGILTGEADHRGPLEEASRRLLQSAYETSALAPPFCLCCTTFSPNDVCLPGLCSSSMTRARRPGQVEATEAACGPNQPEQDLLVQHASHCRKLRRAHRDRQAPQVNMSARLRSHAQACLPHPTWRPISRQARIGAQPNLAILWEDAIHRSS